MVLLTSLPIGLLAIRYSYPLLKYQVQQASAGASWININYIGAALMVATLGTFILSGLHIHEGDESFVTPEAVGYHIPMNLLFLALLALFIVVQQRSNEPFLDFGYFRRKYFSMALFTNTTFHLSMLAVVTLIPIMVEDGLGQMPIIVTMVLLPNQFLGLFLPSLAGWVHDRYNPRWLRPGSLGLIALGFLLLGFFAGEVPLWGLPVMMLPVGIGSNLFNTADNAVVMNTLEENRSFASGMLETTRQMGHTIGTTISATILGLALPVAIDLMPVFEAQAAFRQGFQYSSLAVVWIMAAGAFVAMIQRMPHRGRPAPEQGTGAASQRRRLGARHHIPRPGWMYPIKTKSQNNATGSTGGPVQPTALIWIGGWVELTAPSLRQGLQARCRLPVTVKSDDRV